MIWPPAERYCSTVAVCENTTTEMAVYNITRLQCTVHMYVPLNQINEMDQQAAKCTGIHYFYDYICYLQQPLTCTEFTSTLIQSLDKASCTASKNKLASLSLTNGEEYDKDKLIL